MPYFINPVQEEKCVFVTYEGEMPPVEIAAVRYEATGVLMAKHWRRIVVDITQLRSVPTPMELLKFTRSESSDLPRSARVALVVRPEQRRRARGIQIVARNDGVKLSSFFDAEKATAWVRKLKPTRQTHRLPTDQSI
jgi:hypothetical protein